MACRQFGDSNLTSLEDVTTRWNGLTHLRAAITIVDFFSRLLFVLFLLHAHQIVLSQHPRVLFVGPE